MRGFRSPDFVTMSFEPGRYKSRRKAEPQDEPTIRRMRAEGLTFEDIANVLRLDSDSVASILGVDIL